MTGWLGLIAGNIVVDWYLIEKMKKGVNHAVETVIRIVVGILYAGIVFGVRAADEHAQWVGLFEAMSFWLFFELGLNKARGLEPFYLGTTAKSDKFFRRNFPMYAGLKLFALIILITSVVQLLKGN